MCIRGERSASDGPSDGLTQCAIFKERRRLPLTPSPRATRHNETPGGQGGRVMVLGNPKKKHAYTYVPDLARAVIAVGEAGESAWGRAWHCPNAPAKATDEIVQKAAEICGSTKPPKITVISVSVLLLIGCLVVWLVSWLAGGASFKALKIFDATGRHIHDNKKKGRRR